MYTLFSSHTFLKLPHGLMLEFPPIASVAALFCAVQG